MPKWRITECHLKNVANLAARLEINAYICKNEGNMKLTIKYRDVSALVPYARNAKKHDAENVGVIAASIERFGFLDPVALDSNDVIVWGHGRVLAAELLGMATVPTITLPSTIKPDEMRALRIAHNKLAEKSGWDNDALRIELEDLQSLNFDLSATGFDGRELDNLLRDVEKDFATFNEPPRRVMPNITIGEPEEQPDEDDGDDDGADSPTTTPPPINEPRSSDDHYSQFAIVMLHDNKVRMMDVLDKLRNAKGLDKLEDALMELVRSYEEREEIIRLANRKGIPKTAIISGSTWSKAWTPE